MKQWLSAAEIAALALDGLPTRRASVIRLAARAGWNGNASLARKRGGRGGGLEYHLDILPIAARADYVGRHIEAAEVPASIAREAAAEPGAIALTGPATEARDARLAILALVDRLADQAKLSRKRADRHFCEQYTRGAIDVADWISAEVKKLTPRTLARWRKARRDGGAAKLAVDRSTARRGTGVLDTANDGQVRLYILALLAKQPQLTAHHLRALVADRFPEGIVAAGAAIPLPPIRTLQGRLKAWRVDFRNELTAIRDPDGFKSRVRFAARVAMPARRLNEVWQIDASPADVLTTDGRYSIYVCEDIYSRRLVALVSKTARASAVGLMIRKAILQWGVPERIKTDNGSDFVARETRNLLAALGIEHETAAPFSPEQKGHVERAIGTMQRGLMRTLEGFIGHSVADRKVIEGRKAFSSRLGEAAEDMFEVALDAATLQSRVDEWCAVVYGHAAHAGLKGQSPFAVAATASGGARRIEDPRALDMLLAPVAGKDGLRTATKSGLRIEGSYYIAGFLNVGDPVHVRMDPADLGRVYVFSEDRLDFLGEAIAPELAGIDPAAAISAVRAKQKQLIDGSMADVRKEARRIRAKDIAPAIHRQALVAAGKLAEFPRASTPHDTPALAAARAAADGFDAEPVHSPEIAALAARMRAEQSENVTPLRVEETAHQRWNRARAVEAALARGDEVDADQVLWLGWYREGPEYRGFAATYGAPAENNRAAEAGQA